MCYIVYFTYGPNLNKGINGRQSTVDTYNSQLNEMKECVPNKRLESESECFFLNNNENAEQKYNEERNKY